MQPNPPTTADAARIAAEQLIADGTVLERVAAPQPVGDHNVWGEGESSFEERMAAREFFADSDAANDPIWRRWLLKKV